ncbi:MAG: hypothetical protein ACJA1P_001582 [Maribacter sp.]|jgi:hypothetical protein
MKFFYDVLPWKWTLLLSVFVLLFIDIFSFYGLYTNKFYLFKIDNFIVPVLSIVHFVFLYVLWFKIREKELSNPPMRNLEYSLYIIGIVYAYKFFDTLIILLSYTEYENYLMPDTFIPLGLVILFLYFLLLLLTVITIAKRKQLVGTYHFDDMNQHVDNWGA